jgi:lysozyme
LKKLNKKEYEEIPYELSKWVKAKGKRLNGLVRRRLSEAYLWTTGEVKLDF